MSTFTKLKEIFSLWSQNVDINCYQKMLGYASNMKVQFLWLIILLGSTGATFYFITKSTLDYFTYDVVSKTSLLNEMPTQFPTITFCDNNPFSTRQAQTYMDMIAERNNISTSSWDGLIPLTQAFMSSPLINDEERRGMGLDLNQIECTYNYINCKSDLHWHWSWEFGNCFQFNSGFNLSDQKIDIKMSNRNGKDFGLNIKVFLINRNKYFTSFEDGLVVFVHNSTSRPNQGVYVEPGKMTSIQVERTFTQKQPRPYSDCIDLKSYSSELYDYMLSLGQSYRQFECFDLCIQKIIIEKCECYFAGFKSLNTSLRPGVAWSFGMRY